MPQRFYKAIVYRNPDQDIKVSASRTDFRLLRYFSTVLSSFRYSLETHPSGSNSRGCGRYSSLRTVTEKSLSTTRRDAAQVSSAYHAKLR